MPETWIVRNVKKNELPRYFTNAWDARCDVARMLNKDEESAKVDWTMNGDNPDIEVICKHS